MPFLFFLVVAVAVMGGPLGWYLWSSRVRPGMTPMVLLGAAAGENEMLLWRDALLRAGIRPQIRNMGDGRYEGPQYAYGYEFWVREKNAQQARRVIGF